MYGILSVNTNVCKCLIVSIVISLVQGCGSKDETPYSSVKTAGIMRMVDRVTEEQVQEYIAVGKFSSSLNSLNVECYSLVTRSHEDGQMLVNLGTTSGSKCVKEIVSPPYGYINAIFVRPGKLIQIHCSGSYFAYSGVESYPKMINDTYHCANDDVGKSVKPSYVKEWLLSK